MDVFGIIISIIFYGFCAVLVCLAILAFLINIGAAKMKKLEGIDDDLS